MKTLQRKLYASLAAVSTVILLFSFSAANAQTLPTEPAEKLAAIERLNNEALGLFMQPTRESLRAAREKFRVVQNFYLEIGEKALAATTHILTGRISHQLGDYADALENLNRAVTLWQEVGDQKSEALTLVSLGYLYRSLGKYDNAFEINQRVLQLSRATGNKIAEAQSLNYTGDVYLSRREYEKALDYYRQSLSLYQEVGAGQSEMVTLGDIGITHFRKAERRQALEYMEQALLLSRSLRDKGFEGQWLFYIGLVYLNLDNQKTKALEYFQQALFLVRNLGGKHTEAGMLSSMQNFWQLNNNSRLAIFYGKQSVNKYQELRRGIQTLDRETQKSFLNSVEQTYRKLAELLIKEGRIPEAEQVLEMLKDEEYFQFVRRSGDLAAALDKRINLSSSEKDAIGRYDKITDNITQLGSEYAKLEEERNKPNVTDENAKAILARQDAINEKLKDARIALDKFLEALKQEFSQQDKRVAAVEEGLQAEVKSWGDAHAVVISTIVGKENLSIIVTTPEIQTAHIVPVSEEKINLLVGDFRAALTDPNSDPKPAAQKLYDVLIKPLEKDLSGARAQTLIWSLDGNLRYAPMAALWDKDKGYLIQRFANVVITLASRGNLAARPEGKKAWQALGVGVSKAVGGFQALSYVPEELDSIVSDSSIIPKSRRKSVLSGRLLLNEKFTSGAFRSNLGRYPIVHAATHFSFVSGVKDEALESFLLLGDGEKLTLAQIQNSGTIFNGVQLLALSACDTAYGGKDADGREIEGFGALAQKKGAKAVIATLWRVGDESTRDLMIKFYGDYQKPNFTKAEALRHAQLVLLQESDKAANGRVSKPAVESAGQFKHPYYWGSYILIGNWW